MVGFGERVAESAVGAGGAGWTERLQAGRRRISGMKRVMYFTSFSF